MKGLYPAFTAPSGLDVKGLSRDPEVVRAYVEDPLVHDRISAMLGHSMIERGEMLLSRAKEFQLPVLLMHGENDTLTDPAATQQFYEDLGSRDKTLQIWPGLLHEIHNEPEQAEVLSRVVSWLRARI
jgi:alpha-beta hydrolase superfamily lysophospholipase